MRVSLALPLCLACLLVLPAAADVDAALDDHVLPGYARLADETAALDAAAEADCAPEALRPAFHAAYDAWVAISHIQTGPIEDQGLTLAMAFWPDPKDSTGKALARLTQAADASVDSPDAFAEVSVAAQGFSALERMLYEPQPDAAYACRLTRAISTGLARKSAEIHSAWPAFAAQMRRAGEAGNARFQSEDEAARALYTALSAGLEFLHDQRLGRPMGTFERPRPRRAEARRSERALRNIVVSLTALEDLALALAGGELPYTRAAFAAARERAAALDDPALQGVAEPLGRIRVEALQQAVRAIQVAVIAEIGAPLGISAGFNALDGD